MLSIIIESRSPTIAEPWLVIKFQYNYHILVVISFWGYFLTTISLLTAKHSRGSNNNIMIMMMMMMDELTIACGVKS